MKGGAWPEIGAVQAQIVRPVAMFASDTFNEFHDHL